MAKARRIRRGDGRLVSTGLCIILQLNVRALAELTNARAPPPAHARIKDMVRTVPGMKICALAPAGAKGAHAEAMKRVRLMRAKTPKAAQLDEETPSRVLQSHGDMQGDTMFDYANGNFAVIFPTATFCSCLGLTVLRPKISSRLRNPQRGNLLTATHQLLQGMPSHTEATRPSRSHRQMQRCTCGFVRSPSNGSV